MTMLKHYLLSSVRTRASDCWGEVGILWYYFMRSRSRYTQSFSFGVVSPSSGSCNEIQGAYCTTDYQKEKVYGGIKYGI